MGSRKMIFTKKESYIKQIGLYLQNTDYQNAFATSKDYVTVFPKEPSAHYLLARSLFLLQKYAEAKNEARLAFNMADGKKDLVFCATLLSACYFALGQKQQAYDLLSPYSTESGTEIEKLMFLFSSAMDKVEEASEHLERLFVLDAKAAQELVDNFIRS
ncbi:CDC27 family protein [Candidatus Micrarchaeota archaeon]|nr:CDC27 family protein [Candidatus Micrarchaeota archaeon]